MAADHLHPNTLTSDDDATRLYSGPASLDKSAGHRSQFNHLTVLDIIGQGGVGRVYLAYDETIGRRVAVKELLEEVSDSQTPADLELSNSFVHEAKVTGKLEHPGIVPVYELGRKADGRPYYVMRHIKGETLEQKLRKASQFEPEQGYNNRMQLLDALIDVCNTLAYAHAKGVVHRDLKPGNIILGNFGETIVVDWGLAQVLDDEDNTYFYRAALTHQRHTLSDTSTSEVLGTPAYMAPEQFQGQSGKAADVYSLGVILFRIITGTLPYRGTLIEIQQQIEADAITTSPKRFNPSAPPELIAICEKAIHKNPLQRFADAGELAEQLKAFRDGRVVNVYAYTRRELLQRFLAHNKFMVIMTALLFITICSGAGFSIHYATQMRQAKNEAEQALSLVATYGERSQQQARIIVQVLNEKTTRLIADLNQTADKLETGEMTETSALEALRGFYPHFESLSIRKASEIDEVFTVSDTAPKKPIVDFENGRLMLIFRAPIERKGRVDNYLEARMYPEKVLPNVFPKILKRDERPRDIWIMRNDGLIIYDANSNYIGTNLFTDPNSRKFPALQAFGRLTLVDEDSIGYYSFVDGDTEYYKIAAWDSIDFGSGDSWKVVVNYTYIDKDLSRKSGVFNPLLHLFSE